MNYKLLFWLSFGWLLMRCTSDGPAGLGAKPDNLIDEPKMVAILTDVHLDEARLSKMNLSSVDTAAILFKRLHQRTLHKFAVDTATYNRSFAYYSARPAKLSKIYEQVVERLKVIEKKKTAQAHKQPPV